MEKTMENDMETVEGKKPQYIPYDIVVFYCIFQYPNIPPILYPIENNNAFGNSIPKAAAAKKKVSPPQLMPRIRPWMFFLCLLGIEGRCAGFLRMLRHAHNSYAHPPCHHKTVREAVHVPPEHHNAQDLKTTQAPSLKCRTPSTQSNRLAQTGKACSTEGMSCNEGLGFQLALEFRGFHCSFCKLKA